MAKTGAHKLKDLKITSVDFVDEGANKRADILIRKNRGEKDGGLRRALRTIAKALGLETENDEEPVKKAATDFNAAMAQASMDQIFNEIWKFTDAIGASLRSILTDEEVDDEDRLSLMEESIDQFSTAVKQAAGKWVGKQLSNINTDTNEPDNGQFPKGEEIDMRIDKSKLTEEERKTFEALVKKAASDTPEDPDPTEKAAKTPAKKPATKAGAVDPEGNEGDENLEDDTEKCNGKQTQKCSTKKSAEADPIVKSLMAEVEALKKELKKRNEEMDEKELAGIAKKYEPLGIKSEDLVPTLKSFKAMGDEAYNKYVATLDASLDAQNQSGMFDEIGKSSHGMTGAQHGSTAEAKIDSIAKGMCEKDPNLSYNIAKARAWQQNPDLYEQYEEETGR